MERRRAGRRERVLPARLQVEGVGQHSPGGRGQRGLEQGRDQAVGLAGDDRVDLVRGRGLVAEVHHPQTRAEGGAQVVQHPLGGPVPGLLEEMVADRELMQPGQRGGVPVQRRDQPRVPRGQPEQPPEGRRGRSPGSRVQHAQRLGGGFRRQEQVGAGLRGADAAEQRQAERVLRGCDLGWGHRYWGRAVPPGPPAAAPRGRRVAATARSRPPAPPRWPGRPASSPRGGQTGAIPWNLPAGASDVYLL